MFLVQDRKRFFDRGSFVEGVGLVYVLPYVYLSEVRWVKNFQHVLRRHFFKEFENNDAYALCNSFLGW